LNRAETVTEKDLPCNGWGLYQMHGNSWEWCEDGFVDYPSGPVIDPIGLSQGAHRVLRGGSLIDYARFCRSANRPRTPGTIHWLSPCLRPNSRANRKMNRSGGKPDKQNITAQAQSCQKQGEFKPFHNIFPLNIMPSPSPTPAYCGGSAHTPPPSPRHPGPPSWPWLPSKNPPDRGHRH